MTKTKYIIIGIATMLMQPCVALAQGIDECRALMEQQSYKQAYPICKRAALYGNAEAQDYLDIIHRRGIRLEDDLPELIQGRHTSGNR